MRKLKKDITFIYIDSAEKAMYQPIAEEARKRGYRVRFTDDKFARCEIGFYCQHINFPQFSKFSFIMLHDIIQQYSNWPDLWIREPWNKYDIGFLPNNQWVENWNKCSQYYYANPRIGMFKIGWPKADNYVGIDRVQYKQNFNKRFGLDDSKRTILYAPSWENDGKQDDFVKAMLKLNVNILIKQATVDPNYSQAFSDMNDAIRNMAELHKNIPEVTILDSATNIFEAIMASDILVSEESSTMCEAVMMGVPAVSVSNWLIPDVSPKRFPKCDYDFVLITKKEELTDFISNILNHYNDTVTQVEEFRKKTFGDLGNCAEIIMDIVDDCVAGREIRYEKLPRQKSQLVPIDKFSFHMKESIKREVYWNYTKRYKVVSVAWHMAKEIKQIIKTQIGLICKHDERII